MTTFLRVNFSNKPHGQANHLGSRLINFGKIWIYKDSYMVFELWSGADVEEAKQMITEYCESRNTKVISIEVDDS